MVIVYLNHHGNCPHPSFFSFFRFVMGTESPPSSSEGVSFRFEVDLLSSGR